VKRPAFRIAAIVVIGLLLIPTLGLAKSAPRWSGGGGHGGHGSAGGRGAGWGGSHGGGWHGGGWHGGGWHGGGHWHGGGCCWGWGGFAVGLGVGTLLTAPYWAYPRVYAAPAYPVYAPYPAYPAYPGYPAAYPEYAPGTVYPTVPPPAGPPVREGSNSMTLTPEPLSPAPVAPPGSPAPGGASSAAPSHAGCETVTVGGHWETRVYPDAQRVTLWVPTSIRSICP
jgi:hypothetical protein